MCECERLFGHVFLSLTHTHSSLDLHKEFPEEAYSVALHPSGLFVLVGFSEKLRLMNLLINDIRPYKEFLIRGCREVRFSSTTFISNSMLLRQGNLFDRNVSHFFNELRGHLYVNLHSQYMIPKCTFSANVSKCKEWAKGVCNVLV